jgi:hypothetical protein
MYSRMLGKRGRGVSAALALLIALIFWANVGSDVGVIPLRSVFMSPEDEPIVHPSASSIPRRVSLDSSASPSASPVPSKATAAPKTAAPKTAAPKTPKPTLPPVKVTLPPVKVPTLPPVKITPKPTLALPSLPIDLPSLPLP